LLDSLDFYCIAYFGSYCSTKIQQIRAKSKLKRIIKY
jgi:hypothetical protein